MSEVTTTNTPEDELNNLELPSMAPGSLFGHFGPGLILMMTGIGQMI